MDEKQIKRRLDNIEKITEKYLDKAKEWVTEYIRANNSELLREIKEIKSKETNKKTKWKKRK